MNRYGIVRLVRDQPDCADDSPAGGWFSRKPVPGINYPDRRQDNCRSPDGALVAAAEEERVRRIKHWAGFPSESIRYCLAEAGIRLGDVDVIAINQDAGAKLWKKLAYMLMRRPDLSLVLERIRNKREL